MVAGLLVLVVLAVVVTRRTTVSAWRNPRRAASWFTVPWDTLHPLVGELDAGGLHPGELLVVGLLSRGGRSIGD